MIEAHVLLALAHEAGGDRGQALDVLADALTRAEAERFVRMFLDAGAPMTALLQAAVRQDRTADLASALLAAGTVHKPMPAPQLLVDELSSRELDVLRLLRSELTGPEIAAELVVSINTVRTHTKNIFMKLGVTNRRSAVRRADELGL
jgi:LuxR family maltose regulon positive regulatory protein